MSSAFPLVNTQSTPVRKNKIDLGVLRKEFGLEPAEGFITHCGCSLESEKAPYPGRIYLFQSYLCFLSSSKARVVKVIIPMEDIKAMEKGNRAILISNLIKIETKFKKYAFTMDSQIRDHIFDILLVHWKRGVIKKSYGDDITNILDNVDKILTQVSKRLAYANIQTSTDSSLDTFLSSTLKLPFTEALIDHFACSLEEGNTVVPAGRLYVTQSYIAFHENIRVSRKEVIPFHEITSIDKRNSSIWLLPNAIQIFTHTRKFLLSSFFNRNDVYMLLKDTWNCVRRRLGMVVVDDKETQSELGDMIHMEEQHSKTFLETLGIENTATPEGITLDRYGFEIPEECVKDYRLEEKKYEVRLRKQRKAWKSFLQSTNIESHIQHHTSELMSIIRKGIPFEMRGELWYQFSGAKEKMENSSIGYAELTKKSTCYSTDIGKDIERTFPYHPFFRSEQRLLALERILVAYANRNPSIGYCQSMNFITAFLLLFMPEEDAFWVLVTIVEDRLQDYFSESMIGTLVDQEVFEDLLKQKIPKVAAHIQKYALPLAVVTTRWFMCMFISMLPTETTLRIWDLFFYHGSPIIIMMALALIKVYEPDIREIVNTEQFMNFTTTVGKTCFDCDNLIKIAFHSIGVIDIRHLNYIRVRFWTTMKDYLEDENKKRDIHFLERHTHFTNEELEAWYENWCTAKLKSFAVRNDVAPRDALGVDFDAFSDIFVKLAPQWGTPEVSKELRLLFDHLDKNDDQLLDFKEMVIGVSIVCKGTVDERLQLFFKIFAKSNRSELTQEECKEALRSLYNVYLSNNYTTEVEDRISPYQTVNMEQWKEIVLQEPLFQSRLSRQLEGVYTILPDIQKLQSMEEKPKSLSSASGLIVPVANSNDDDLLDFSQTGDGDDDDPEIIITDTTESYSETLSKSRSLESIHSSAPVPSSSKLYNSAIIDVSKTSL